MRCSASVGVAASAAADARLLADRRSRRKWFPCSRWNLRSPVACYQVSLNGRASSSKLQAERSCATRCAAISAMASGFREELVGLVRHHFSCARDIDDAVDDHQRHVDSLQAKELRAIDSASARCADLAGAKAAERGPPRREAVAPVKIIAPCPFAFIAGSTACESKQRAERADPPRRLELLGRDVVDAAERAAAGIVEKHVGVAEIATDRGDRGRDRGRVADVAGIRLRARELGGEGLRGAGVARQQRHAHCGRASWPVPERGIGAGPVMGARQRGHTAGRPQQRHCGPPPLLVTSSSASLGFDGATAVHSSPLHIHLVTSRCLTSHVAARSSKG